MHLLKEGVDLQDIHRGFHGDMDVLGNKGLRYTSQVLNFMEGKQGL
jgi:hypothetical protein